MQLIFNYIIQLMFLIFMQVFVFQKVYLTTFCVPFFYSMIILTLPIFMNRFYVLLVSFIIGWLMDIFYHTGGIHTSALTTVGFLRYYWLKIIEPSERYEEKQIPVAREMTRDWFIKYATPLVFIHHLLLFTLEAFRMNFILDIFVRSIISSFVAILLIYFFHLIFFRPKQ